MGRVYLNIHGEGSAYVIPDYNLSQGEEFTIYSVPFEGSELEDIRLWTSYDESIAITPSEELTLTYQSAWRNVYAEIYFTGSEPPPEPEPPKFWEKYPWLLAKAAKEWRINGKY